MRLVGISLFNLPTASSETPQSLTLGSLNHDSSALVYIAEDQGFFERKVQKKLNYSDDFTAAVWPDHQFSLSLDQSLLIAMNDEARWMTNNNLTPKRVLPRLQRSHLHSRSDGSKA